LLTVERIDISHIIDISTMVLFMRCVVELDAGTAPEVA
jgi:hypothetical protein